MADFRIYGAPNPVAEDSAGVMTQGLGFPLRQVDNAPAQFVATGALAAASFTTQQPTAVDTPIQLEFGAPQTTDFFDVDALGNVTVLQDGVYFLRLRTNFGRVGSPGVAIVFLRALLNGIQLGNSVATELDDGDDVIPGTFSGTLPLSVGDVITAEVYRDSAGINEGGVFARIATLAGWADSPSAQLTIEKFSAGEEVTPSVTQFSL